MPTTDQHILMLGLEVVMTSADRRAKATFDTAALWRISGSLGHSISDAWFFLAGPVGLQREKPPADFAATGGAQEFGSFLQCPH